MTALEIAQKQAEELKKQKEREKREREAQQTSLQLKQAELGRLVNKTLKDFKKLPGVTVNLAEQSLKFKDGHMITFKVEYETGRFRPADDCDEQTYETYLIRWYDSYGRCLGGCSKEESFNHDFGLYAAKHI